MKHKMMSNPFDLYKTRFNIILFVTILGLVFLAWFNRFIQDDAFISFRYAYNLVNGIGLVWNEGERIEGYTNFLWTLAMSIPHLVLSVFLVSTLCAYLLLPYDWMGEYRFATPFFVFLCSYGVVLTNSFIRSVNVHYSFRMTLIILTILIFTGGSIYLFNRRSIRFAHKPTTSFAHVAEHFGHRFNQYATKLGIKQGSILLPDIGGTLYYTKLRVYDLGGLCNKTIAKTFNKNQHAFYNYVFEIARPTFIHIHHQWTYSAALDKDERFRRDYIPIHEYLDSWVKNTYGSTMYSGNYVRKDVVANNMRGFYQMQSGLK